MNDLTQIKARYLRLREISREVNNDLTRRITKDILDEGGNTLGILQNGALVFDSEDEMAILMDFCIHDVRCRGRSIVQQFLDETPYPPGSEKANYLDALSLARYSVYLIKSLEPGVGLNVIDIIRGESCLFVDVNLSGSAQPGLLFASRMVSPDDINMSTGATLPLGMMPKEGEAVDFFRLVNSTKSFLKQCRTPDERSEVFAVLIRGWLASGAAEYIAYEDPGEEPSRIPRRSRRPVLVGQRARHVPRNGPCPCGSGKKFKNCCDSRR